jgi:hypothetical protein
LHNSWTLTAELIRNRHNNKNGHMDILLASEEALMKGVIYSNLRRIFEEQLQEGKTYTIYDAKLKPYQGLQHNPPVKSIQMEFSRNTKVKKNQILLQS